MIKITRKDIQLSIADANTKLSYLNEVVKQSESQNADALTKYLAISWRNAISMYKEDLSAMLEQGVKDAGVN